MSLAVFAGAGSAIAVKTTSGPVLELWQAVRSPSAVRDWTLDRLVVDLASALLLVAAIGLAASVGLTTTAAVAGRRAPALAAVCSRATPRVYRRMVAALLGIGLTAPVIGFAPALAVERCGAYCHGHGALDGLGYPDLPATSTPQPPRGPSVRQVVVREGDSLWSIAEERLPAGASTGEIATLTWRLYALNRSTIGDDPDLIYPEMTLLAPEGGS